MRRTVIKTLTQIHEIDVDPEGRIYYIGYRLNLIRIDSDGESVIAGRDAEVCTAETNHQDRITAFSLMPNGTVYFAQWARSYIPLSSEIRFMSGGDIYRLDVKWNGRLYVNSMCVDPIDGSLLLACDECLLRVTSEGDVTEVIYSEPGQSRNINAISTDGHSIFVMVNNKSNIVKITGSGIAEIQAPERPLNMGCYGGSLYIVCGSGLFRDDGSGFQRIIKWPPSAARVYPKMVIRNGFIYIERRDLHEIERFSIHKRWDRSIHRTLPGPFRREIKALHIIANRTGTILCKVPRDILFVIYDAIFNML